MTLCSTSCSWLSPPEIRLAFRTRTPLAALTLTPHLRRTGGRSRLELGYLYPGQTQSCQHYHYFSPRQPQSCSLYQCNRSNQDRVLMSRCGDSQ